jgi:hypothetical protein
MKFSKETVLAGSRIVDGIAVRSKEMELKKLYETRERILEQWHADQIEIEKRAREILEAAQRGEVFGRDVLDKAFLREDGPRWGQQYLGLDQQSLDKVERQTREAEERLEKLRITPSDLTRFLEAIEDDKISDYAIKGAGFKVRLADLVLLGLEQEKQDAEEQTA